MEYIDLLPATAPASFSRARLARPIEYIIYTGLCQATLVVNYKNLPLVVLRPQLAWQQCCRCCCTVVVDLSVVL